jgi:hypothetical protein
MGEHTTWPQPPVPAPQPHTLKPRPRPSTPESHTLSGLEFLKRLTPQQPCPLAPTLGEAEAAGNISDVNVEQQQLSESAGGDGLPDVRLPDVRLPDVRLPDVRLPDVPLSEAWLDGSVGKERTSPRIASRLGSGSCLVNFLCCTRFISGTD